MQKSIRYVQLNNNNNVVTIANAPKNPPYSLYSFFSLFIDYSSSEIIVLAQGLSLYSDISSPDGHLYSHK